MAGVVVGRVVGLGGVVLGVVVLGVVVLGVVGLGVVGLGVVVLGVVVDVVDVAVVTREGAVVSSGGLVVADMKLSRNRQKTLSKNRNLS